MNTNIQDYLVRSHSNHWTPLVEAGVDCTGISWMPLRFEESGQRPITFLLKFEPGSQYPYHNHPQGEEIFVLQGSCEIENTILRQGDYLYTPANYKHGVKSKTGCVLFLMVPQEVEIL